LGKHIPGLELVPALISHEAALQPDVRLYQRLLAGDQDEAMEILEQHLKADTAGSLYDAIIIPALAHAECDRIEGRLSDEEAAAVVANASEIVEEVAASVAAAAAAEAQAEAVPEHERVRVLGHPARSEADALALRMLEHELGPG